MFKFQHFIVYMYMFSILTSRSFVRLYYNNLCIYLIRLGDLEYCLVFYLYLYNMFMCTHPIQTRINTIINLTTM